MNPVKVQEYGQATGVALDAAQRRALLRAGAGLSLAPDLSVDDAWTVLASSRVGVVSLPGLTVRISPKLQIARLFTMLSASSESIDWSERPAEFESEKFVEDIVAMALCHAIESRVATGLVRGYVTVPEESMCVRGKIDFTQTLRRNPATLLPISQTPEFLVEDIPENRIMSAAASALLARVREPRIRARLMRCRGAFADVAPLPAGAPLPVVRRTRLNARWWGAIELALLVLRGCGLDLPTGGVVGKSFVVDMNVVFEKFVHRALAEAMIGSGVRLEHNRESLFLDTERKHSLRPDLSIWDGERCVFAGDCKYKFSADGNAARNDIYQSLAYATAAKLCSVTLIYGESPAGGRDVQLIDGKTTVKVRALRLDGAIELLREQFSSLAREILASC